MKLQIRRGVFETNSSSVHSLTMCSGEEYRRWKRGELYYDRESESFHTPEEVKKLLKVESLEGVDLEDNGIYTEETFFDWYYGFEYFCEEYTTKSGEEVVCFGYYGYDG